MVKELRTTPLPLRLGRLAPLSSEDEATWGLSGTQTFLPSLEQLFKTETLNQPASYGIRVADPLAKVVDATTIQTASGKTVKVHRKTTGILSSFRWMRGDYGTLGLPKTQECADDMQRKVQGAHTAAYIGALAATALSETGCLHFPKVYGVYCGMAKKHSVDISDDYEELTERPWFAQNIGKTFQIRVKSTLGSPQFQHTRSQRPLLQTGEDAQLDDIPELGDGTVRTPTASSAVLEEAPIHPEELLSDAEDESESVASTVDLYAIHSCDCSEDGSEAEEEDDDEDFEPFAWVDLANVPVVTTVMEACEGTLYELLEADTDPVHQCAYFAQVVLALAYAQRVLAFTHNDLHGNNILWVPTDREFLYYNLGGTLLKVPTYGRLLKVIDFERAIFAVRLPGMREPKTFMSDQYAPDEEAGGMFNMEPFYTPKVPEYKANPSCDLARLATSVYWDLFPEGPNDPSTHPLKDVLLRWMTLPDGTSVLFRKQGDNHDRYHGFTQYKAIARYCKDTAVPRKEPALQAYKTDKVPMGEPCLVIEP